MRLINRLVFLTHGLLKPDQQHRGNGHIIQYTAVVRSRELKMRLNDTRSCTRNSLFDGSLIWHVIWYHSSRAHFIYFH